MEKKKAADQTPNNDKKQALDTAIRQIDVYKRQVSSFACRFSCLLKQLTANPLTVIFLQYAHHV